MTTTSLTATAINNADDVAGFYTAGGKTSGFVDIGGVFTTLNAPKVSTEAFGINNRGQVVGDTLTASGKTFGFVYTISTGKFKFYSDPNGVGTTNFNGINDNGDIVGFYTNSAGGSRSACSPTPRWGRASLRLGPRPSRSTRIPCSRRTPGCTAVFTTKLRA